MIQFQEIDRIGLLLYYDNPDYYDFEPQRQREALIDELNSYGFEFKYEDLGVDKLRTLLLGKTCFSEFRRRIRSGKRSDSAFGPFSDICQPVQP